MNDSTSIGNHHASPPCNRTRTELDTLLERCDFGAKKVMFGCYFEDDPDKQPLCIACKQSIARHGDHHRNGGAAADFMSRPAAAEASMGTVVVPIDVDARMEEHRDGVDATARETVPPDTVCDGTYNRTTTSYTRGLNLTIACAVTCVVTLQFTLFVTPFWLWRLHQYAAFGIFIIGCIVSGCTGLGFFFAGCSPRTRTVHVAQSPVGSPSRELFYEKSCVFGACCCSSDSGDGEDALGQRHTVAEVAYVYVAADDAKLVQLYTHGHDRMTVYDEAASRPGVTLPPMPAADAADAWRAYLCPSNPSALQPPAGWKPVYRGE